MTDTLIAMPGATEAERELRQQPQTSSTGTSSWHITSEPIWTRSSMTRVEALTRIADGIADRHAATFRRLARE